MTIIEKLFSLLRLALWGKAFDAVIAKKELARLIKLAQEQTVLGLVFDAVSQKSAKGQYDKRQVFQVFALTEQIRVQNAVINKELVSFANRCQNAGIKYLVVKGQTLGCLYAKPELRSSGDIDFLVPDISQNLSDVFPGVHFPEVMKEKELGFKFNNIVYELHTRLIDFGCKSHQKVWENIIAGEWKKEYCIEIDGVKVRTLSPTANAVYLFLHLYFHLIREGVSLRQLCDWAVMLHHYKNDIDNAALKDILRQLDMMRGYKAFGSILVDELGLPEADFPLELTAGDRIMKGKILEDIFRGGNFGKHNHKAKSAIGFKMETFRMALRNSMRYYRLAPSEMRMMIPKMIKINMKLVLGN